ncbi:MULTISPECIES: nuclear transport factor 2 family protein [unclassified Pseudonocardia]|uniref:nuclear transport factor 2 family protein n=1 Tax=unclassified Pseudonocardia TaxID=2619320 RepID=UPI0001FFE90D|nr:nuclear transport factor 2 family protein [Pseudonocardia sp. Ae707_Ps1]OLM16051.1 hypothetical protein Ae707Ps1_0309c [Pseudonocardia sp. Ae707_Ps1]
MDEQDRRERAHRAMDAALDRILDHDMAGFAALWAPGGTMDFPFAAAGSPSHLDGRDAVARYVDGYNDLLLPGSVVAQTRHETTDPDTLVVEFTVEGRIVASGEPYTIGYVAVVTVGPEGITGYRDYWSPLAVQDTLGRTGLAEPTR